MSMACQAAEMEEKYGWRCHRLVDRALPRRPIRGKQIPGTYVTTGARGKNTKKNLQKMIGFKCPKQKEERGQVASARDSHRPSPDQGTRMSVPHDWLGSRPTPSYTAHLSKVFSKICSNHLFGIGLEGVLYPGRWLMLLFREHLLATSVGARVCKL